MMTRLISKLALNNDTISHKTVKRELSVSTGSSTSWNLLALRSLWHAFQPICAQIDSALGANIGDDRRRRGRAASPT
jgi:hypothetical protein